MTILFNFSHPFSSVALEQLQEHFSDLRVVAAPVQLDMSQPLPAQVSKIVDKALADAGLNQYTVQTNSIALNLPGMSLAAGLVLAEFSGRAGYLPRVLQMAQKDGIFVVAGVIDLQAVRNEARLSRQS